MEGKEYVEPSYYAVIPSNVRYDNRLKPNEKLLYSEITALSNKTGICYATNKYFAELYEVECETISRWIKHLKELMYIDTEIIYKNDTKEIDKRIIKINGVPIDKKVGTYLPENQEGYRQKNQESIDEKIKENNTSINNTSINKEREIRDDQKTDYSLIVNELLNYYEFQSRKYRVDMPKITNHERILLTQVVRGKPLASLHKAVDKTLFGAIDYPIGYLIKCISNIEPNNVSIKEG